MTGAMMDMAQLSSKFLAMGMPLNEVIKASTWNPAQQIKRTDLGHLSAGAVADIAVFQLMEGDFAYRDAPNGQLSGKQRLFCELTLSGGRVTWDWNSRRGRDYRELSPTYGARPGVDHIIPPPK